MKLLLAVIGLAAIALALTARISPPQPAVLVSVPDPALAPIDDLNLNGAEHG